MQTAFTLGWEEWLALPQLKLSAIKAKIDTGAKTSALHASDIVTFEEDGKHFARFIVHPDPEEPNLEVSCTAPIVDRRNVTSSNGEVELRYVIETELAMGERKWTAEVTLTNRENMVYRMLLGRSAIEADMYVDANASCVQPVLNYDGYRVKKVAAEVRRPLSIALMSREPENYSSKRIVEAAELRGHTITVINTTRCYLKMGGIVSEVHYDGAPLPRFDAIIPRIGASTTEYGMAVLRQFANTGAFCLNKAEAIGASRDKLLAHQILAGAKIGTPVTAFAHSPKDTKHLIELVGGAPAVVKLLSSTQGRGVVLAETKKASESLVDAFRGLDANFLIQEFVAEAAGADTRCLVIGNKVVGAIKRQAQEGEFRSNLHRGGTAKSVRISKEVRTVARRAAKQLGLSVAGVDILESKTGPKVLEVNSSPGLQGVETATKKDIAGMMIEFIESKVRASAHQ